VKPSKFNLFVKDVELPKGKYILCNTLSGEFFMIDEHMKSIFDMEDFNELSENDALAFKKANVILEDDSVDESLLLAYRHDKEKYSSRVLNLTILLTMECNLRCVYCYEGAGIVSNESLNDAMRDSILSFIKNEVEARKLEHVSLCLFGGEPLLGFNKNVAFLEQVKSFCEEKSIGFSTSIVTNGTLVNQENLDLLVAFNCQLIQITLDGTKDFHDKRRITSNGAGSFDETIRGIKMVVNEQRLPNPVIRINIDKTNIENTYGLFEYLKNHDLTCCSIDFGIVKGTTAACASYSSNCFVEEELGEMLFPVWQLLKSMGFNGDTQPFRRSMFCGLYSDSAFTITPTGDVYKCWDLVNQQEHKVGYINEEGKLVGVTNAYFKWMLRTPYYIEECKNCVYLPTCGGGCAAISYSHHNDYNAPGCYKVKTVFEKQVINKFKNLSNL